MDFETAQTGEGQSLRRSAHAGFGRKYPLHMHCLLYTSGLGAVVNIVLDPIFIFGLNLGVKGAALATVIAQGCSAVWVLRFLTGPKAILKLRLGCMKLKASRVKRIITLGLSGFFMNLTNSCLLYTSRCV